MPPSKWVACAVGVAGLVLVCTENIIGYGWPLAAQFALLAGGMVALGYGFAPADGDPAALSPQRAEQGLSPQRTRPLRTRLALSLLVITLLAFGLRVYRLETAIHTFVDEHHLAAAVANLLETVQPPHLLRHFSYTSASTWVYPLWASWGVEVLGRNLTGLRIVSALCGALTILPAYWLARGAFGESVGLAAALILATYPPHLHFSRLGLYNIADPLFGTLAFAAALYGLRTGNRWGFAWAGIALGASQYFYEAGRLLFPVLMLTWLLALWLWARRGLYWRGIWRLAVTFVLTTAPIYSVSIGSGQDVFPRLAARTAENNVWGRLLLANAYDGSLVAVTDQLTAPFALYVTERDHGYFYMGNTALVLPLLVPLLAIAVGWGIWKIIGVWCAPITDKAVTDKASLVPTGEFAGATLLLLWVFGTSAGNTLLDDGAWVSQFTVVFPAIAIVLAWGTILVCRAVQRVWRRIPLGAIFALLVCGMAVYQADYYLRVHVDVFANQFAQRADTSDLLLRAAETLPPNTELHLLGWTIFYDFDRDALLQYLGRLDLRTSTVYFAPTGINRDWASALDSSHPHAFFILPNENPEWLNRLVIYISVLRPEARLHPRSMSPYRVSPQWGYDLYLLTWDE
ncbi:MAG: ArnT family glycosyltransferase [Phototrophicaceae bacterium]|jgi:4-amino-4-deoxy-L-arabinose transferase-like glycosyltransferase